MPPDAVTANIHHFFPHPETGVLNCDEDGDVYLGFYFQITDLNGEPISHLMGPYNSAEEAETACKLAWETDDY